MPASQNGTKAKYAKRRPASYLHGNKKEECEIECWSSHLTTQNEAKSE